MNALLAVIAAKPTVWEKILAVPRDTWVNLLVGLVLLYMLSRIWMSLKEIHDIVPWVAFITIGGILLLYWTYERTEPRLLTPLIDKLAEVFPSKLQYKGDK